MNFMKFLSVNEHNRKLTFRRDLETGPRASPQPQNMVYATLRTLENVEGTLKRKERLTRGKDICI